MAEYIDKNSLIGLLVDKKYSDASSSIDYGEVIQVINSQLTADVQEVRHGKWEYEDSDVGWTDYRCDSCGNIITTIADPDELYNYCPSCGAKMDKE